MISDVSCLSLISGEKPGLGVGERVVQQLKLQLAVLIEQRSRRFYSHFCSKGLSLLASHQHSCDYSRRVLLVSYCVRTDRACTYICP